MVGFLFGGNTGLSYNDLQERRAAADELTKRILRSQPRNTSEGIGAVLAGIGSGIGRWQANKGMREGREGASTLFDSILSKMTGQPASASGGANSANLPMPGAANDMAASAPGGDYFSAIRTAESGGNDNARNPNSSATGRYQFIDSTWRGLMQNYPELGLTADGRTDPAQQEKAIQVFTRDNAQVLEGSGIPTTGGNLYAAHFLGADGARRVLSGNPSALVSSYLDQGVVRSNPFLQGMTVADFQKWAGRKGGGDQQVSFGGNQMVSLDPSAGMSPAAAAIDAQAAGSGAVAPPTNGAPFDPGRWGDPIKLAEMPPAMADLPAGLGAQANAYAGALPPLPSSDVAAPPPIASVPGQASQQVAQAGQASMPQQRYQIDPQILQFLASPFADESQKQAVRLYLQHDMQAHQQAQEEQAWRARQDYEQQQRRNDPAYQLGLERTRAETERLKQGTRPITADERRQWGIPDSDQRPYAMTPDGPKMVGGGGQTINFRTEIDARRQAATEMGIDPNSEEGKRYILTGALPAGDRGVTAGDREAIRDADDQAQSANSVIDQLQSIIATGENGGPSLNERAGYGATAGWQSWAARNDPTGFFDDAKGEATTELNNTVLNQALGSLKSIFGAAPTEGERQILLDMQASVDKTPAERKIIIEKGIALAKRRLAFNRDRAAELRGGTYYKPDRGAASLQTAPPTTPADPANSAGPQPGDVEDGFRFKGGNRADPNNWERLR